MPLTDTLDRNLDHQPREHMEQALKILKDLQNRRPCNKVISSKRVREPKAVDGSKCGECQHMNYASAQGPDRNATKRLLRRNLAVDVEMLKEEMEHMKGMLASHESLLTQQFKKKRVSSQMNASQ
ncbi:hypothetical protein N7533_006502 [Penicillium manginii]|uniref:uncharacterized protein n=1 Tax=Penicillium manginii TaxID=203109 RepID=UPI0025471C44|nr:uncharacterized protein N7533_006502 [Penicillium manginii]KAJ5749474.1 hypothetical protein N7533_006502 [Penicillium manginii]